MPAWRKCGGAASETRRADRRWRTDSDARCPAGRRRSRRAEYAGVLLHGVCASAADASSAKAIAHRKAIYSVSRIVLRQPRRLLFIPKRSEYSVCTPLRRGAHDKRNRPSQRTPLHARPSGPNTSRGWRAMASEVHFAPGELIFQEGDHSSLFYLLISGTWRSK